MKRPLLRLHPPTLAASTGLFILSALAYGVVSPLQETSVVDSGSDAAVTTAPVETPATLAIASASSALESGHPTAEKYVALGTAMSRRARETADPAWYDRSDEALAKGLELAPDDFAARRMQIWNQLGRHEFEAAYGAALALNQRAKDDVLTYGLIVDAATELGRYQEAENAAQWMLNLRPGTPAAMTRVSYLREQFGDLPGALDAMTTAFHSTRPSDTEDRAWILTHLAHLELQRGEAEKAKAYAENAIHLFPDYHYALGELAEIAMAEGDVAQAKAHFDARYRVAPHPENLFHLAVATEAGGDAKAAEKMFAEFESAALAESTNVDNANLELIEYWTGHVATDEANAKALDLAKARAAKRSDIGTLEALAWTQHLGGDSAAAWETMSKALSVGSVKPRLRYRAAVIAQAADQADVATEHLGVVLQTAPGSAWGTKALELLKEL